MLTPSEAGFRRLLPLLRPHLRRLILGLLSMAVFVGSWPLLMNLVGRLIPALGSGQLDVVLPVLGVVLVVFLVQKLAQFLQDSLLAGPALQVSQSLRSDLFQRLQRVELGALEKLSAGDLTYRLTEDADRVSEVIYKTLHEYGQNIAPLTLIGSYLNYAGNHVLHYIYNIMKKKVFHPAHKVVSIQLL